MQTLRQQGFAAALQNQAVITSVLQRYHITPSHPEFDDYYQEGLLAYVAAYCQYQTGQYSISQANYIYTKVRQRVIDLLRQRDCYTRYFGAASAPEPSADHENQWLQRLQLQQLLSALEKDERRLLMLLYHDNCPVPEICAHADKPPNPVPQTQKNPGKIKKSGTKTGAQTAPISEGQKRPQTVTQK